MQVGVIGINHKSAELQFRELFAKICQQRFGHNTSFIDDHPYILLSTCNRTEIYFSSDDLTAWHTQFFRLIRQDIQEDFEHMLYSYFGSECFLHLARVTSGIDSALLHETEIQGQVKHAYEMAYAQRTLCSALHFMFQKCLKIGKEVRSTFRLVPGIPQLEETICDLSYHYLGKKNPEVLFVGASEINCKIYHHLLSKKTMPLTFCNRNKERLRSLFENDSLNVLPWENLSSWIKYELIIFATKSPDYLVKDYPISSSSKKLLIDLSVPRNVHPHLARNANVHLLNVDQINHIINQKRDQKAKQFAHIEKHLIHAAVVKQIEIFIEKDQQRQFWLAKVS